MPRPAGYSRNPIDDVRVRRNLQALRGGLGTVPRGMLGTPETARELERAVQAANSAYTFSADAPAVRSVSDEVRLRRAFHALGEAT